VNEVCRECGCTNLAPCPGDCHWVELDPPLCSRCAREPAPRDWSVNVLAVLPGGHEGPARHRRLIDALAEARARGDAVERLKAIAAGDVPMLVEPEEARLLLEVIEEARTLAGGYAMLLGDERRASRLAGG